MSSAKRRPSLWNSAQDRSCCRRASFEEMIKNIAEDRKSGGHEKTGNRNEAVFLLDELKRQGGIS